MRVSIEHSDGKAGLIKKTITYEVEVTVDFTEEELAVITANMQEDRVLAERYQSAGKDTGSIQMPLQVKHVMGKPDTFVFETPAEAINYTANLQDAFAELKTFIEHYKHKPESVTFEL